MSLKIFSVATVLLVVTGCQQSDKNEQPTTTQPSTAVQPPIKDADVPYSIYTVEAAKGDTLFYKTGSIILFLPHSFVDKNGKLVEGNITVKYREFTHPIDFFLSGIPMTYDSLRTQYLFESSGMCEILAFKDSLPVFVNPEKKPEINLATQNNSPDHSLYYLDTAQAKWINKGKSTVTVPSTKIEKSGTIAASAFTEIPEPIKPEKANTKSPLIKIEIDPGSFEELLAYNNLQFQIDPNDPSYRASDATEEWNDIQLVKGEKKGLYRIKFSNASRSVQYSVVPVLDEKDYDKAIKVFEKKRQEYEENRKAMILKENNNREKYTRDSIADIAQREENKRIERLNAIIEIRNKEIERRNKIIEAENNAIRKRNAKFEELIQNGEVYKKLNTTIRSFEIDGFGIWNCDKPVLLECWPLVASFKNKAGESISLSYITVIFKSLNGVMRFNDRNIRISKDADNMIIGVYKGRFAYSTPAEVRKLGITEQTREQTFMVTIVDSQYNNYEYIKSISEQ